MVELQQDDFNSHFMQSIMDSHSQETKYLFVGGGVASGIGKGITISSLASCLKNAGFSVNLIKIDPYLNVDAGTMSPWEHGEVFILKDGGEVDLDLGNYERYLDHSFTSDNNITSGKIFQSILNKEREGHYLGKTIQFFPHLAEEIIEKIYNVGNKLMDETGKVADIVLVEIGGTVGDVESIMFYEAVRQIMLAKAQQQTFFLMVSYVPYFNTTGEQKTKPTQNAIQALRMTGIRMNALVVRSKNPLEKGQIQKIAKFANLSPDHVLNLPDLESIHDVPVYFEQNQLPYYIMFHLQLPLSRCEMSIYNNMSKHINQVLKKQKKVIQVAVVGKYVGIEDAYISIKKAIESACLAADQSGNAVFIPADSLEALHKEVDEEDYNKNWALLKSSNCIIIPGGFDQRGLQGKIDTIKYARENKVPILGICLGFQAMCIEYARNVMNVQGATTAEMLHHIKDKLRKAKTKEERKNLKKQKKKRLETEVYVINDMPDASQEIMGGTMRKGEKNTIIKDKNTIAYKLYNTELISWERYRHRYEVALDWLEKFVEAGIKFTGFDESGNRMEILELAQKDHPYFLGVQFHPEFTSRNFRPNPCFLGLIKAAQGKLQEDFKKNGKLTYEYYWNN